MGGIFHPYILISLVACIVFFCLDMISDISVSILHLFSLQMVKNWWRKNNVLLARVWLFGSFQFFSPNSCVLLIGYWLYSYLYAIGLNFTFLNSKFENSFLWVKIFVFELICSDVSDISDICIRYEYGVIGMWFSPELVENFESLWLGIVIKMWVIVGVYYLIIYI